MQNLYRVNEKIKDYKNIVIYGTSGEAIAIFCTALQHQLHVDGFVDDDEDNWGVRFFNKKVISRLDLYDLRPCAVLVSKDLKQEILEELKKIPGAGIFFNSFDYMDVQQEAIYPLFHVNDRLEDKKAVIFGCGITGQLEAEELCKQGIEISCYCDNNPIFWDTSIGGKKVIPPEMLFQEPEQYHIIIAVKRWREVWEQLKESFANQLYLDYAFMENSDYNIMAVEGNEIGLLEIMPYRGIINRLYRILQNINHRRVFIYGNHQRAWILKNVLLLCDVQVEKLVWERQDGLYISSVYDLYYLDSSQIFLVNADENLSRSEKILLDMGYIPGKHFLSLESDCLGDTRGQNLYGCHDFYLGNTYIGNRNLPGFTVFGEPDSEMKIVTLGGSTTDALFSPFKSWSELLYQNLKNKGYSIEIFCGGIAGYNSSNELIKMIRDVIILKPDLVISYSGINDMIEYSKGHPFLNDKTIYMGQLLEHISGDNVVTGLEDLRTAYEIWFDNERTMEKIAEIHGIKFIGILQPVIGSRLDLKNKSFREILLNHNLRGSKVQKHAQLFRDSIGRDLKKNPWLMDFSNLFDAYDFNKIFLDLCHINEYGNQIVAEHIGRSLKKYLQ